MLKQPYSFGLYPFLSLRFGSGDSLFGRELGPIKKLHHRKPQCSSAAKAEAPRFPPLLARSLVLPCKDALRDVRISKLFRSEANCNGAADVDCLCDPNFLRLGSRFFLEGLKGTSP